MIKRDDNGARTNIMSTDQDFAWVPQELLTRTCTKSYKDLLRDFIRISRRSSYKDVCKIFSRASLEDLARASSRAHKDLLRGNHEDLCKIFALGPVQDHARTSFIRRFHQDL
jgi:hypothetical protein